MRQPRRSAVLAGLLGIALGACYKESDDQENVPPGHLAFITAAPEPPNLLAGVQTDGADYHQITILNTISSQPALSKNSSTVIFAFSSADNYTGSTSIAMVPYASTNVASPTIVAQANSVSTFSEPSWDATGENIYFLDSTGGNTQIVEVPAMENGEQTLVNAGGLEQITHMAVLDSEHLLVVADAESEIYELDLMTHDVKNLGLTTTIRPAVSPDGTEFVYLNAMYGLETYVIETSDAVKLDPEGVAADENPCFSPTTPEYVAFDNGSEIRAIIALGSASAFTLYPHGTQASWGE